ncbi:MAG TPA: tetratricopeptide repeat protein [Ktedonobacteraceae bacterium]
MAEANRVFGDLLTQGLKSIAASENKGIIALEDALGFEMNSTRWSIEKWRQGAIPSESKKVEHLARACVSRGGMQKQWLTHFLSQARFIDKEDLIQDLFPNSEANGSAVRRNLPGRNYEHFVGREEELARIEKILSHRHRLGVVCLTGIGGIGKTALALEAAHRHYQRYASQAPEERFEAIVWVTAKQSELLPAGIVTRHPTFTDLNDIYRVIAEVLELPAITRTVNLSDRDVLVAQILSERRVLLVLDNLEDIDDQELMVFLRDLPVPSKAIVTTRHRIDVAVPIQVRGFNDYEARELIHSESQRHNLTFTLAQEERLLRIGYLPLAIVRTLGRMAWRKSNIETELRLLGFPNNDIQEFCFKRSMDLIQGGDAYQLFSALALFSTDATREALGYAAGFHEAIFDRDEGLSKLEILSLINRESGRFSLEPLTKVKAQSELAAHPEFEKEARQRQIEWYQHLAMRIETEPNDECRNEVTNLKTIIDWLIEQKQMAEASWFFRRISKFLFLQARWGVLVRWADHIIAWGEIRGDTELLVEMLNPLTNIFLWQAGLMARGKDLLQRILLAVENAGDLPQATVNLSQLKISCQWKPCSNQEITEATQVIEVFRTYGENELIVDALKTLGNIHLKLLNIDEAVASYQEGLRVLELSAQKEQFAMLHLRAALTANLGHVAYMRGSLEQARELVMESVKNLTAATDLAEAYVSLALFEYRLGHLDQAHQYHKRAERYAKQVNMARPICLEDEEWLRLAP